MEGGGEEVMLAMLKTLKARIYAAIKNPNLKLSKKVREISSEDEKMFIRGFAKPQFEPV
jgi:hypothetical protein